MLALFLPGVLARRVCWNASVVDENEEPVNRSDTFANYASEAFYRMSRKTSLTFLVASTACRSLDRLVCIWDRSCSGKHS